MSTFSELGYYIHTETIAQTLRSFCKAMAPIYALLWLIVSYVRQFRRSQPVTRLLVRLGLHVDSNDADLTHQALIDANSFQQESPSPMPSPFTCEADKTVDSTTLMINSARSLLNTGLTRYQTAKLLGVSTYKLRKLLRA